MTRRINPFAAAPEATKAMLALSDYVQHCGLEAGLMELVEMRASQINGCAYCLHMHSADARKAGESEARLYLLDAWRESELYTARERAALAWTEALTLLSESHAPDAAYAEVTARFSEAELVKLTLLIGVINVWNRICVGFRCRHPNDAPKAVSSAA